MNRGYKNGKVRDPNGHTREHITINWDPIVSGLLVLGAGAVILYVAVNDITIIGIIDDAPAIPPLITAFNEGIGMVAATFG